ncbi:tetratricopeptide repeat protein [Streptomyces pseudovenezuelae]|uniref:tetratricopeptide repeat protein n=2 Tax=Streptomyces pseudovenezuelae TaxID=67350 RepID=UPI002E81B136|nr:tetratricopeptide repeat protein [Streptomyces pseudovenezuelae]WUA85814.1 tetratricopeptide repeat protein [Streptomyces pseudovenezuelae]WUA93951.1 tetratricopeptide repeat protein [Streptomyces pseudovenezuelae]
MTPEEALTQLRQRVDRARVTAGLAKKTLAERTAQGRVKVSRTTVQQFFRADGPIPSMDTVTALATVLKLDVQDLLDLRDVAAGSADVADEAVPPEPAPDSDGGPSSLLRDGPRPEPRLVGPIPPAALAFQHRAEADQLRAMLENGGTTVLEGQSVGRIPAGGTLVGLGGVGKSQLAADYARTILADGTVDVVVWVTATERSAIIDRLAQAARELCACRLAEPDQAARAFLAWLAPRRSAAPLRWLVVLDDLTLPEDMDGLWPPASPQGRTLVTTRRQDAALTGPSRNRLQVGLFTPAQAITYLAEALAAYERTEPDEDLAAMAADHGHLPLALSQAAAYLADTGATVGAYRRALADRATALHDLAPDLLPDQQSHTVAAAWALSIDHADTLKPEGLARPLLQLAACLDPYGIPTTVLTSGPARAYLAHHRVRQPENQLPAESTTKSAAEVAPISAAEVERAISALRRLSLLTYTPDTPATAVRVHQLLQHAVRDTLTPAQRYETAHAAADSLTAAWPDIERDTRLAQALRANTTALGNHVGDDALYRSAAHAVMYRAGTSLGDAGQVAAARDHFARLTAATHRRLGPDHPDTLTARHHLAFMQDQAGDPTGAVAAFTQLLDDRVRVLGPDHPDTLSTRHHLATARGQAGDPAGAANALQGILEYLLKAKGWVHPDTLHIRYLLAYWQGRAGNLEASLASFPEVIADLRQVLGREHPDALTARADFASMQGEAGDAAGAVARLAELVDDMTPVLGSDHPYTLIARMNLASMQGEAGDAAGAVARLGELLDDMLRVLGRDHPATLFARLNLILGREQTGDEPGVVVTDLVALLADQVRVLGLYHPDTFATRHNLAVCRGEAGDAAGAVAAFEELLSDHLRELGSDHPETATIRGHLTYWNERVAEGDAHQSTDL